MKWPFTTKRTATAYARTQVERIANANRAEIERLADCTIRAEGKVDAVWKLHTPPYPQNKGSSVDAYLNWYCPECHTAWPCDTVQAIKGGSYSPLQSERVAE